MRSADAAPSADKSSRRGPKLGATARDRIADVIRDDIIRGRLSSGMRIDLDALAAELGTSRTPVREACLALMHEGLVQMAPRSGVTVVGLSPRDVEDNFALMAMLSGSAAAWAAERGTPGQHAEVRRLADNVRIAATTGGDIQTANFLFHRAINHASNSSRLLSLLRQTSRIIPASFFDLMPDHAASALNEHDEIVVTIIVRDVEGARQLAMEHLVRAGRALAIRMFGDDGRTLAHDDPH